MSDLPKKWPCPNPDCSRNLGTITKGELVVDKDSVANINTEGINLVLVCKNCGRVKVWFAKPKDMKVNFLDMMTDEIAGKVLDMIRQLVVDTVKESLNERSSN